MFDDDGGFGDGAWTRDGAPSPRIAQAQRSFTFLNVSGRQQEV
jgi:hypothetical protein